MTELPDKRQFVCRNPLPMLLTPGEPAILQLEYYPDQAPGAIEKKVLVFELEQPRYGDI